MVKPISSENNFSYLTIALVFLLFASALVDQLPAVFGQRLVQATTVLTLLIGIWSLKSKRTWFRTGIGFVVALILILITSYILDFAELDIIQLLILLGFFIWTNYLAARQVLFTGSIDGNKIIGSICIYLLIGLIWTILYLLILEVDATAFSGLEATNWYHNFPEISYYSFVTLTTLGYGDIRPVLPTARFLAYMEAIVGVFYMAILVASLIGVQISEHKIEKNKFQP